MVPALTAQDDARYRGVSFWHDTVPDDLTPRAPLAGDEDADVAIIGAGLTGLWTAWYLLERDPSLRVVLLEREIAGFGASGRNGGWCSALFPRSTASLERAHGLDAALAMRRAMIGTVDEVMTTETLSRLYRAQIDVVKVRDQYVVVGENQQLTSECAEHAHE